MNGVPKIEKTLDYGKFRFLKENRPINKYKVAQIKKSIKEDDQTAFRPILVNDEFGIVDGQHQFTAQMEMGLPIYYVMNPEAQLRTIALLNAYTTNWSLDNYLRFYVQQGNEEYKKIENFKQKYHLSASLAMGALTMQFHNMGALREDFKKGRLLITHEPEAEILMDEVMKLRNHMEDGVINDREFYNSYVLLRNQIDFDVILETLEKHNLKFERRITKKEYMREFEDILNFRKKKNLMRFY